jgi:hypothetical protein
MIGDGLISVIQICSERMSMMKIDLLLRLYHKITGLSMTITLLIGKSHLLIHRTCCLLLTNDTISTMTGTDMFSRGTLLCEFV